MKTKIFKLTVKFFLKTTLMLSLLVMSTACDPGNKAVSIQDIAQGQQLDSEAKVNGSCGLTDNSCLTGALLDSTDLSTQYLWSCNGTNGGTNAACSFEINLSLACDIL